MTYLPKKAAWLGIWLSVLLQASCGTPHQHTALYSPPSTTSASEFHSSSYSSSWQTSKEARPETLEQASPAPSTSTHALLQPWTEAPLLLSQAAYLPLSPLTYSHGAAAIRSGWFWQGYGAVLTAAAVALAITTAMTAMMLSTSPEFPEGDLIPQQQKPPDMPGHGGAPDPLLPVPLIFHDKSLENWQENFPLKGKAQIEEDPALQIHSAVLRQRMPYALEDVYEVLTDYSHFNQFMPHTKKSEVIKQSGPGGSTKWVDYTLVFLMWLETQYVLKITHQLDENQAKITWTLDSGENFQDIRGTWVLRRLPASFDQSPQTAVTYISVIEPKITIPRAVFDAITKKSVYELFEAISKRLRATQKSQQTP